MPTTTASAKTTSSGHRRQRTSRRRSWWQTCWQRYFTQYGPGFAQLPYWGALALLILLPLFYQGGIFAWLPVALAGMAVLYAVWLLALCLRAPATPTPYWHPALLFPGGLLLVGLMQLLPLGQFCRYLSPLSWQCWEQFNATGLGPMLARLTISPENTLVRCELLLFCLLLMLLLLSYSRSRAYLRITMGAIVVSAFANALLSFWILFSQPAGYTGIPTGSFLNRNHFAFMMTMGIFSACALLAVIRDAQQQRGLGEESFWPKLVLPLSFMAFGSIITQVLSLSRGAFLSTITLLVVFWILWLVSNFRNSGAGKRFPALPILVATALLFALQSGLNMLLERYKVLLENEVFTSDTRWQVWEITTQLMRDTGISGIGLGAYSDAIQRYEPGLFPEAMIGHAHNDWLELASELGWPLTALLLLAMLWLGFVTTRRIWRQKDYTLRWLGLGALTGLLAAALHECFDYNLQAMPNAMLFTALLTVFFLCGRPSQRKHNEKLSAPAAPWGWPARTVCLLLVLLVFGWALARQFRQIVGARYHHRLRQGLLAANNPWQPSKKDLQGLLQLADAAQLAFPNHGMLLQRRASCWSQLAYLNWPENRDLLQYAIADSIAACRLNPANGDFLLFCALLLEDHGRLNGQLDEEQLRSIYALALTCYPGLSKIQLASAEASRRAYWRQSQDTLENRRRAQQLRAETLQLFANYMQLHPESAKNSFAAIMELSADPDELLSLLPDNTVAYRELLLFFRQRQHYQQGFKLLQKVETLPQEPAELFYWQQERSQLLALTGQWAEQQALLPRLWQAASAITEEKLPPLRQLIDEGNFLAARQSLNYLNRQAPPCFASILLEAEVSLFLGKNSDIAISLLPFAYAYILKPEISEIKKAISLLEHSDENISARRSFRERFLRVALPCLLAERTGIFSTADLLSWEHQLLALETELSDTSGVLWLQGHLLPLFTGRVAALNKDWPTAAAAYRRSLALSADNLITWEYLQQVPEKYRTAEENAFVIIAPVAMPIHTLFSSAFALWQVQTFPEQISKLHQQCEVEYTFLCVGDIQEESKVNITFATENGNAFSDSFAFQDLGKSILNLKVGEILRYRRTYQPLLKIATTGRPLHSGQLTAHIILQSQQKSVNRRYTAIPPATFPVLEIKLD